jgi:hypothetical protein
MEPGRSQFPYPPFDMDRVSVMDAQSAPKMEYAVHEPGGGAISRTDDKCPSLCRRRSACSSVTPGRMPPPSSSCCCAATAPLTARRGVRAAEQAAACGRAAKMRAPAGRDPARTRDHAGDQPRRPGLPGRGGPQDLVAEILDRRGAVGDATGIEIHVVVHALEHRGIRRDLDARDAAQAVAAVRRPGRQCVKGSRQPDSAVEAVTSTRTRSGRTSPMTQPAPSNRTA